MQLVKRMTNLVRGALAQWLGWGERRHPGAVYEAAIQERLDQYGKLRGAVAGVLYLRSKLARELEQKATELGRVRAQLEVAVEQDDDEAALALIGRRDRLAVDVERLTGDLGELTEEAEEAKRNLVAFQDGIVQLRDEKVRMLARLANARARLRLQETFAGLSTDADVRALDGVREHIGRLVTEVHVGREAGDTELERRLVSIRDAEAASSARAQLDELKRSRERRLPAPAPRALVGS
jgi:phage shock protein A